MRHLARAREGVGGGEGTRPYRPRRLSVHDCERTTDDEAQDDRGTRVQRRSLARQDVDARADDAADAERSEIPRRQRTLERVDWVRQLCRALQGSGCLRESKRSA